MAGALAHVYTALYARRTSVSARGFDVGPGPGTHLVDGGGTDELKLRAPRRVIHVDMPSTCCAYDSFPYCIID